MSSSPQNIDDKAADHAAPNSDSEAHSEAHSEASHRETVGPTEFYDPVIRSEFKKAAVWIGTITLVVGVILLAQPILLIVGGLVLAAMLDGGARLLGRLVPLPRPILLTAVILSVTLVMIWTVVYAGSALIDQAISLKSTVANQVQQLANLLDNAGLSIEAFDIERISQQIFSSVGRVTAAVSSVIGGVASVAIILVLAIFIAAEPRMYERGVAWMLPLSERDQFYANMDKIGYTLRRLMAGRLFGMAIEGFATWILLWIGGVPLAALLGILTGLLAFLPNIGAIISGVLIILVGFSGGVETGLFALCVYVFVQFIDGYVIVPMVAKRAVDLAPALVLGAQILFGTLFGIIGLALADPIIAMIKVALESHSERVRDRAKKSQKTIPPAKAAQ